MDNAGPGCRNRGRQEERGRGEDVEFGSLEIAEEDCGFIVRGEKLRLGPVSGETIIVIK